MNVSSVVRKTTTTITQRLSMETSWFLPPFLFSRVTVYIKQTKPVCLQSLICLVNDVKIWIQISFMFVSMVTATGAHGYGSLNMYRHLHWKLKWNRSEKLQTRFSLRSQNTAWDVTYLRVSELKTTKKSPRLQLPWCTSETNIESELYFVLLMLYTV